MTATTDVITPDAVTRYVGDADGKFFCLNARTGDLMWSVQTAPSINGQSCVLSPAVYDEVVFVPSGTVMHAYAATTGSELYTIAVNGTAMYPATTLDGMLYFGTHDANPDPSYLLSFALGGGGG
jgi:outer membrane protein assembly factor BamB